MHCRLMTGFGSSQIWPSSMVIQVYKVGVYTHVGQIYKLFIPIWY